MNSEETTCSFCIYNKSPKNEVSCPMEGAPEFTDYGTLFRREGPEEAVKNCLFYTCQDGAVMAAITVEAVLANKIPATTITFNDIDIVVAPFETSHKSLMQVYRVVEISEPHRVFILRNNETYQMSDRLATRVSNLLRLRAKKAASLEEL